MISFKEGVCYFCYQKRCYKLSGFSSHERDYVITEVDQGNKEAHASTFWLELYVKTALTFKVQINFSRLRKMTYKIIFYFKMYILMAKQFTSVASVYISAYIFNELLYLLKQNINI